MIQFLNNKTQKNNYCHFPESTGKEGVLGGPRERCQGANRGGRSQTQTQMGTDAPGKSRYSTTRFGHVHVFMGNHVYGCTSG